MKRPLLLVFLVIPLFTGCVAQMVMDSQDRQHYCDYVTQTQRLNLDREKAGLKPDSIMTFDEWHGTK